MMGYYAAIGQSDKGDSPPRYRAWWTKRPLSKSLHINVRDRFLEVRVGLLFVSSLAVLRLGTCGMVWWGSELC
jgi:hypothetical protein